MVTRSTKLCRELAGSAPGGSLVDRADWISQAIEQAEDPEGCRFVAPSDRVSLGDARRMVGECRAILDLAHARLMQLQEEGRTKRTR